MSVREVAAASGLSAEESELLASLLAAEGVELAAPAGAALAPRPAAAAELPLSFSQERLWFLDRLLPGSAAYNVPATLRLTGRLAAGALAAALSEIARRHEALRTVFAEVDGRPLQIVRPAAPLPLPLVDLSRLTAEVREAEAARIARAAAVRAFDLEQGPLLRCTLLSLAPAEHWLLLAAHHIVSDGWSIGVFVGELAAIYPALAARRPSPLAELPLQYADYALWQRASLGGESLAVELAHWRRTLAGLEAAELPADRPRPARPTFRGAVHGERLAAGPALAALGRREGATPFMVLLAALWVVVARLTGRDDVAVGTAVANRSRPELEGLIGFFVNTLVLRGAAGDGESFRALVGQARGVALEAFAHQELPFERVVEELAPERDPSRTPLFQAIFAVQNVRPAAATLPGLVLEAVDSAASIAKFDLAATFAESAGEMAGAWSYRRELYDATTVARWAGQLAVLAAAAAADPDLPVGALSTLSPAERSAVLVEWSGAPSPLPAEATIHGLFARQAAERADAVAVEDAAGCLTYGELARRAVRLAGRLAAAGVGPEIPVALLIDRSASAVVAMVAILAAGGAYVPLDPTAPRPRLARLLADTAAPVVVTTRRSLASLPVAGGRWSTVLLVEEAAAEPDGVAEPLPPPLPRRAEATAAGLAYIMYTSGSTGEPKGVAVVHRAVVRLVRDTAYADFGADEAFLQLAPLAFDAATFEIWGALLNGGRLIVAPPGVVSLAELDRLIAEHGVTTMFITTALFHAAVEGGLDALRALRRLLFGGEVLSPRHLARARAGLPGVRLVHCYGPTENTTFTTCETLASAAAPVPIGRPIANSWIRVVDGALRPVPIGATGELAAGGLGLARGYFRRPAETAERFVPDPFGQPGGRLYRTGDLVRFLAAGAVDFVGRMDAQVKIRGFRIEPGEVESALAAHPAVAAVAVVVTAAAAASAPGGEVGGAGDKRLVAYVVSHRGDLAAADLQRWLAARVPAYLVPSAVVFVDSLPLNAHHKVDRRALAARPLHEEQGSAGAASAVPRTPLEELVAGIFTAVLGRHEVGIDDDFFALGGHSLLATQVIARLRGALGVELPVAALFEQPTVAGVARAAAVARGAARPLPPPLERAPRGGALPLSFAQERLWFLDRLQPGSPAYNLPAALECLGPLDVGALHRALAALADRHETLRTRFELLDGRPVQRIAPAVDLAPPVVDLAGLPAARRETAAARLVAGEAWRPFDLACGPLVRAILVRLADRRHALLVVLHHALADGWSIGILIQDLAALYRAAARGVPAALAPLAIQYADFAIWQRSWLSGAVLAGELGFWRSRLEGLPPLLELPTDRPRPAVQGWRGASRPVRLGGAISAGLRALCQRTGTTPFMALGAAFFALLARLSGQRDVGLGVPVAGRTQLLTERLIGLFVNTLVLRAELPGERPFARLLERVREDALAAYEHQEVPFERLVEELRVERSLSHSPLFQVMFAMQNAPTGDLGSPGLATDLALRPWPAPGAVAKFDLTLTLSEAADGIGGTLSYATALFDAATIDRLGAHLGALLAAVVADPERRLADLPLLAAAARHQLVAEWNDTAAAAGDDALLRFASRAAATPGATAIEGADGAVSYRQLAERAGAFADRLRARGIGLEDRVAVLAERTPATLVAYLGILAAGAAYVALDPLQPAERLTAMLEDAWQGSAAPILAGRAALTLPFVQALAARGVAALDPEDAVAGDATVFAPPAPPHSAAAYVIYTSGSTGRPKGVVVSRGALANLVAWHLAEYLGDRGGAAPPRATLLAGTGFDASVWEIWSCLAAGGTLVVPDDDTRSSPSRLAGWLAAERITSSFLPTPLAEAVLAEPWPPGAALAVLLTGGDLLHAGAPGERPFRLVNHYGPTESAVVTTAGAVAAGAPLPPIGRPIGNLRVHLLERGGQPAPVGVAAELAVAGAGLARGYLGDPARTAESFVPDPLDAAGGRLYRSGDLARWLPDGRLEFLGRADGQVKIRGIRVELGEIEAALAAYPGVAAAAAALREIGGVRRLIGYLVPRAGEVDTDELRRWLKQRLPPAMIPAAFVAVAALPLSASGKVDRAALPAPAADAGPGAGHVAPRNAMEELLAGIWSELLGAPRVGAHDSFFDLGGHSLQATRLMGRVRETLGVSLEVRAIFEAPTLGEFAGQVAAEMARAIAAVAVS